MLVSSRYGLANVMYLSSHRRKCNQSSIGRPCMRCNNLSLECSLVVNSDVTSEHKALSRKVRPIQQKNGSLCLSSGKSVSAPSPMPQHDFRRELVLLYFPHVHDKHHSLFHQPSVELELENEQVPDILLYAMMALGAR